MLQERVTTPDNTLLLKYSQRYTVCYVLDLTLETSWLKWQTNQRIRELFYCDDSHFCWVTDDCMLHHLHWSGLNKWNNRWNKNRQKLLTKQFRCQLLIACKTGRSHFDVLSFQRGVGIFSTGMKFGCSTGNITGCLIEPFYLWCRRRLAAAAAAA